MDYLRRGVRSIPLLCVLFFSSCHSGNPIPDRSLLNQDFYFSGNAVQIQGRSRLADAVNAGGDPFMPIEKRREICKRSALLNSHSKWLSLTMEDRTDPADWRLRLDLGAIGPWSGCLESAKIVSYFYDSQESCRITVIYSCLPQRY